jgi:adenosylmethionine-8-amino-7-oxononanoate aminotransferase
VAEKVAGFFAVRGGRFLEKHMFSGSESFEGPFVMQADGQRVVDAIDGWVIDDVWCFTLGHVLSYLTESRQKAHHHTNHVQSGSSISLHTPPLSSCLLPQLLRL